MEPKGFKIYRQIKAQIKIFETESDKFYAFSNKAAAQRARVALDRIARLKIQWRRETVR